MSSLRMRTVLVTAGALLAAGLGTAAPASATDSPPPGGGWQRFHAQPFTDAPGDVCAFGMRGDIVYDDEWFRTTATYPDGTPKQQDWTGPLGVRFTNLSTGASVTRDLSGSAVIDFGPDGSQTWHAIGPFAVGFHAGNVGHPVGEYRFDGFTTLVITAGHDKSVPVHHGPTEDICATLS